MERLIVDLLGPYILTCTDIFLLLFLCGYKKKWWKAAVVLLLLLNLCRAAFEYSFASVAIVKNTSYILRYFMLLAAAAVFARTSIPQDIYYVSLIKVADDMTRMVMGKLLQILFAADYLMTGPIGAFLAAHLLLILTRFMLTVWIKKETRQQLVSMTKIGDVLTIVAPALLFLLIRDVIRIAGMQPAELDMDVFLLTAAYGCVVLYSIIKTGQLTHQRHDSEKLFLETQMRRQQEQFVLLENSVEKVNRTYHDLRHMLRSIQAMEDLTEIKHLAAQMAGEIRDYETVCRTGNATLDILLSEKMRQCAESEISLNLTAQCEGWGALDKSDLAILFGNALDNAVESARLCPGPELRRIDVQIGRRQDMLFAQIVNGYHHTLRQAGESFSTTKPDHDLHGYGLKSMERIVRKYDGDLHIQAENGCFVLTVFIPVPS